VTADERNKTANEDLEMGLRADIIRYTFLQKAAMMMDRPDIASILYGVITALQTATLSADRLTVTPEVTS
jgi:hypothetical protein